MKRGLFVAVAVVASGLAAWAGAAILAPGATNAADKDCTDFKNQAEAQDFYESEGPGDPHGLDADGDGVACESNPCPCSSGGDAPPTDPPATETNTRKLCGRFLGARGTRVCLKATTNGSKLKHVKDFRFKRLPAKCRNGLRPSVSGSRSKIDGDGKQFRAQRLNIRGGFFAVRATLVGNVKKEGRRAAGTVRVRFRDRTGSRCDTGSREWRAG